jgi:hypothetical protein
MQAYQMPQHEVSPTETNLVPDQVVLAWLQQFDSDDHVECAAALLTASAADVLTLKSVKLTGLQSGDFQHGSPPKMARDRELHAAVIAADSLVALAGARGSGVPGADFRA